MEPQPTITMEEVTDPIQIAAAQRQREQFDRNSAWLQANIPLVYSQHRGKYICIAGEELFVDDTAARAIAQANQAHPDDAGRFTRYIPLKKVAAVYAI
jgi:hypothetical protein